MSVGAITMAIASGSMICSHQDEKNIRSNKINCSNNFEIKYGESICKKKQCMPGCASPQNCGNAKGISVVTIEI